MSICSRDLGKTLNKEGLLPFALKPLVGVGLLTHTYPEKAM